MKFTNIVIVSFLSGISAARPAPDIGVYYQPNGVFVPVTVHNPPSIINQQSPSIVPTLLELLNTWMKQPSSPGNKSLTEEGSVNPQVNHAILEFVKLVRMAGINVLQSMQPRLEQMQPADMANLLRAPMEDLRSYLTRNWPSK